MTSTNSTTQPTRDKILQLLTDGEFAGVDVMDSKAPLGNGDEYLDLDQLEHGVQRARGAMPGQGNLLPRKAVREDTWRKVLRQLAAAP